MHQTSNPPGKPLAPPRLPWQLPTGPNRQPTTQRHRSTRRPRQAALPLPSDPILWPKGCPGRPRPKNSRFLRRFAPNPRMATPCLAKLGRKRLPKMRLSPHSPATLMAGCCIEAVRRGEWEGMRKRCGKTGLDAARAGIWSSAKCTTPCPCEAEAINRKIKLHDMPRTPRGSQYEARALLGCAGETGGQRIGVSIPSAPGGRRDCKNGQHR